MKEYKKIEYNLNLAVLKEALLYDFIKECTAVNS